jgi:hypothetical protein
VEVRSCDLAALRISLAPFDANECTVALAHVLESHAATFKRHSEYVDHAP